MLTGVGLVVAIAIGVYYCVRDAKKRRQEKELFVVFEDEVNPMGIDEIIEAPFQDVVIAPGTETTTEAGSTDSGKPVADTVPVPVPQDSDLVSPDEPRLEARHRGRSSAQVRNKHQIRIVVLK